MKYRSGMTDKYKELTELSPTKLDGVTQSCYTGINHRRTRPLNLL
jgi:hypothetical protein